MCSRYRRRRGCVEFTREGGEPGAIFSRKRAGGVRPDEERAARRGALDGDGFSRRREECPGICTDAINVPTGGEIFRRRGRGRGGRSGGLGPGERHAT